MKSLLSVSVVFLAVNAFAIPWDDENDIRNMPDRHNFEYNLNVLPRSGKSKTKVWSGDWWPLKKGGMARKGPDGESPLSKLEKVEPMARGALKWELDFNRRNAKYKWGGHCNGLAVAGIVEREPKRAVVYDGVRFTPDEIKGLLMEVYQGPMPTVGGRCRIKKNQFKKDSYGRVKNKECQDLNPGTFHLSLANYLGEGVPLIYDTFQNDVVFNWPAYKYTSKIAEISEERAARMVRARGSNYPFNNQARRFFRVQTQVWMKDKKEHIYTYVLEADSNANIIGGEWTGKSRMDHPDFVWRPTGNFSTENFYITPAVWTILEIANRSR